MRYQIYKVRNGLWVLEWESGVKSQHSSKEGAERMLLQIQTRLNQEVPELPPYKHGLWEGSHGGLDPKMASIELNPKNKSN